MRPFGLRRRPGVAESFPVPHSLEAEVSVIGAVLLNPEAADDVELKPGHFFDRRHQEIWRAIASLYGVGRPIDIVTVAEQLKAVGSLDAIGGAAYLAGLDSAVATSAGIKDHARIIIDAAVKRQAISIGHGLIEAAAEKGMGAKELIERAEQRLMEIGEGAEMQDRLSAGAELAAIGFKQIEKAAENPGLTAGLNMGLSDLDRRLCGLQPEDLVIVAARPSMGKNHARAPGGGSCRSEFG